MMDRRRKWVGIEGKVKLKREGKEKGKHVFCVLRIGAVERHQ